MVHQEIRSVAAFGFFQNRAVHVCDRRIELSEQLQKFFAPAAGPGCQCQTCELPAAFFGEQLFLAAQALAHREEVSWLPNIVRRHTSLWRCQSSWRRSRSA